MTAPSLHEQRLIPTYLNENRGPGGIPVDGEPATPVEVRKIRGATVWNTGQVRNIGTQPTPIVGVDKARRWIEIRNIGTVDIYLGPDTSMTDQTGYLLSPTDPPKGIATTAAIYAVTLAGPAGLVAWHSETDA